jgi:hypothetical protein
MRFAHVTTDEVNQALAIQAARAVGAIVTAIGSAEIPAHAGFDAVLYDLDRVPLDRREMLLDEIGSDGNGVPLAVYGYCLSEAQAQKLRFRGVAVAQRFHAALMRTLAKAARKNLAAVPPDDAMTDLTWINLAS